MRYEVALRNARTGTTSRTVCIKADVLPSGHLAFTPEDLPDTTYIESLNIVESIKELP